MSAALRLTLRPDADGRAVDADGLLPERLSGLSRDEVSRFRLQAGPETPALADLFSIEGEAGDSIEIDGDLSGFARLGGGMTRGAVIARGPVGPCAGSGMSGGMLTIEGTAAACAGEGMRGGLLRIRGDAGERLAGPRPGDPCGMNRGAIVIDGSVGSMAAMRMRRGTIVIGRDAGPGAGCGMLAGTIVVVGRLGVGAGALMRRGTIAALGGALPLPIFLDSGTYPQPFLELYLRQIGAAGVVLPPAARPGRFRRLVGDISDLGRGEILIPEGSA